MDKIIISLTTIDSRLEYLKNTLISIFNQTFLPDIIHVWYSSEPFLLDNGITSEKITQFIKDIQLVNIKFVKLIFQKTENIGSYRKLIPSLKLYTNSIIITIDDDHELAETFIEKYIYEWNKHKCIICSWGRIFDLHRLQEKKQVVIESLNQPIYHVVPEGFGGILYHTSMFDSSFINFNFLSLSDIILKNDDLFFRMWTFYKKIPVIYVGIKKNELNINDNLSL